MIKFQSFLARRKRTKGIALSLLAAVVSVSFAVPSAFAESTESVSSLLGQTITVTAAAPTSETEMAEFVNNNQLTFDIYQIAESVEDPGYDSYKLKLVNGFTKEILGEDVENDKNIDTSARWEKVAQNAAKDILQTRKSLTPVISGQVGSSIPLPANASGTNGGLYLMLIRGLSVTYSDYDNYVDEVVAEGAVDGTKEVVTFASGTGGRYNFDPIIFAAPSKDALESTFNTADPTEWKHSITLNLKGEKSLGRFQIRKVLDRWESKDPATFVFNIDAVNTAANYSYHGVASITFDSYSASKVYPDPANEFEMSTIPDMPVGTEVTISEVYTGVNYKSVSATPVTIVIGSEGIDSATNTYKIVEAFFENDYSDTYKGGGSIVNPFKANVTGDNIEWEFEDNHRVINGGETNGN